MNNRKIVWLYDWKRGIKIHLPSGFVYPINREDGWR